MKYATQKALDAFKKIRACTVNVWDVDEEIAALEEALAKQEQGEPVAEITVKNGHWIDTTGFSAVKNLADGIHKLYTTPQQRDSSATHLKPLTQQEVVDGFCKQPHKVQFISVFNAGVRFAEAAHGIKE